MNHLDIQIASPAPILPNGQQFQEWVDATLHDYPKDTEIVIRVVDEQESATLNGQYRHKQGATNILSFPFTAPEIPGLELNLLGDLVICAPVLQREADEQHKNLFDHWAHIVIHGILHLLGYDHISDDDAELMETKEIAILQQLNIQNPYLQVTNL